MRHVWIQIKMMERQALVQSHQMVPGRALGHAIVRPSKVQRHVKNRDCVSDLSNCVFS